EKGFPLFVEAARSLQNASLKLIAQCHLDDPDDGTAATARGELEKLEGERVQLVREPVDSKRYYEILSMADIVVLPYRERNYRARTSGVLVEALAAGKPVVVTKGTWLEEQTLQANA